MNSKDKKGKNAKETVQTVEVPEPVNMEAGPPLEEVTEVPNAEDDDDVLDVDLSAVEIASSLIDETFSLDDSQLIVSDNMNEAYKNIMSVCSTTAHSIKQTINDVLNSRERVVITEVDPTTELQESLNQKIADFAKVVSGSFTPQDAGSESTTETQSENEVEAVKVDSKEQSPESSVIQVSEGNPDMLSAALETKSSDVPKDVNSGDKKSEPVLEMSGQDSKPVSQLQFSNSPKEMLKNTIPFEEEKMTKKQKNGASKKKGDKSLDQILKTLGNGSADDKLHVLGKRYMETLEELRLIDPKLKQLERQLIAQQRDKEQLQAEHNRMILAKSRLEGLCREMQRQSKSVKEESLLRIKEEEEKRKEIANKFQATLNDISSLMQENSKNNAQLREENAELATKLKSLVDNYEVWEQNVTKVVQQKELEAQLAKAKHAKVNLLLKQEAEKFLREKQSLLENLSELQKRCALLATNELQLRTELADYTSKYEEFQSVLTNSSKVFATFKTDMESTSKKIKKLEKETNVYKQKWESSNNALLDMISHKEKQDKEFANAQQRILTLEKLCRALQAERNELQNQLNIVASNSVSPTSKEVPSIATETGVA